MNSHKAKWNPRDLICKMKSEMKIGNENWMWVENESWFNVCKADARNKIW